MLCQIISDYLFTGRRYDPESDNYYYRARYYSHKLGRFLSEDPLGFDAGDYNFYRYVFNNPLNFLDPTGETVGEYLADHRDAIAVGAGAVAATAFVVATGGVGLAVIAGAAFVGAGVAAATTVGINAIDRKCNIWEGAGRNAIYGAAAGAGAGLIGPTAGAWGSVLLLPTQLL